MLRVYKCITTNIICISTLLFLFTISCKKQDQPETLNPGEAPVVIQSISNKDARINEVNSPDIKNWEPEVLQINFAGGRTADSPLRFNFNLPMVPTDSLSLDRRPDIQFEPKLNGTYTWESPTLLVFQPEAGQLTYGERVQISIDSAAPLSGEAYAIPNTWSYEYIVPYFQMAGKVASWPVIKGAPRFVNFLNWRSYKIGEGPIYLLYDQPIELANIQSNLDVTNAAGTQLKHRVFRPGNIEMVFDGEVDMKYILGLQVEELPGENAQVIVKVPQWNENKVLYREDRSLQVKKNFSFVDAFINYRWSGYEYMPIQGSWNLTFTNWVSIAQFEKALKITPAPKSKRFSNGATYDYTGQNDDYLSLSTVQLVLDPGTDYTLSISEDLIDVLGNKIANSFDTTFRTMDLAPVLELPKEAMLVEKGVTTFPIRTRNLTSIRGESFEFESPEQFAKALLLGKRSDITEYGLAPSSGNGVQVVDKNKDPNVIENLEVDLKGNSGLYCVKLSAMGTGTQAREDMLYDMVLVQSSNVGITSKIYDGGVFAWVTTLDEATPLAGIPVKLYDGKNVIGRGTTDDKGVVTIDAKEHITSNHLSQSLLIIAGEGKNATVAKLDNKEFSNAWQFGLQGKVEGFNPLNAVIFTERGVYRPGEKVHLKTILGNTDVTHAQVIINDPRGQQVVSKELELDDFNAASMEIPLKEQAAVGQYSISVSAGNQSTTRSFKVEEYRVPTFQVKASSIEEEWEINKTVQASVEARYLHGGTLDGREVKWMVSRVPVPFTPKAYPQYIFSWAKGPNFTGVVNSGNRRLDGNGRLKVKFTPDHPPSAGAMRYTLEATATDIDRQAYAGRISKIIHPASFYIGLKPPSRSILSEGEKLKLPVIALSPDGKIVEGAKVKVLLERIDHHTAARLSHSGTVQVLNRPEAVKVFYYEIKTGRTPSVIEFDMEEAGHYRINAWTEDKRKKLVQAGFEFTVSGGNPIAWPRFDQEKIDIIADKENYKVGDEAKLVVQSPYKTATGILTMERDDVISYELFDITQNTPEITIPITEDFAPNVFVSMVIIRGRIHDKKDASGFETGAPGLKIGYTNLIVEPVHKALNVEATLDKTTAIPGDKVKVDLKVTDHQNAPVAGQVTLMLVDEAILGLTGYQTPEPLGELYAERLLGTRTGSSLLDLPHAKRSRLEKIFPGGDADRGNLQSRFPAELRKLFESTAYYNPNVLLDPSGKATINIDLPDNLTTFRLMAIAVDKSLNVGSTDAQVEVRQPLMIQPVLPRFVYPDDELTVEALVYNGTNRSANAELIAEFEGINLTSGNSSKALSLKANGSGTVSFPVKVTTGKEVTVRYAAKNGKHSDAVEVKIPILEPGTKRNFVASKRVTGSDQITMEIPEKYIKGSTQMEVVLSTTNLSELKDAVQYLMRYPNGCIEQTTSTAYPLVVLKDLLPEIGIEVNMDDLKKFSEAGVRRILSFQTPAGGLSYWPDSDQPHAFATAFGLTALIEAKRKGYDVPDESLEGMANYLEKSLREGKITEEMPHGSIADADTRALFVMTLGRLGRPQPGYISILWQKKDQLSAFGLSFLAIAVKENPGDQSLLQPILAEIKKTATQDADQAWYQGDPKGGWTMDSPLRTHAGALMAYATANTGDNMTSKYLKGLMERRQGGMWGNTQENVFGIMGVYESSVNKAGGETPLMLLQVNGKAYDDTQMEKNSPQIRRLKLAESDLSIKNGASSPQTVSLTNQGGAPIIFTVRTQYDVPLAPENMAPVENGFTIERKYETLEGKSLEGKDIKLGSLVRVRVSVKTAMSHHYVAIDDKLPAGLEPLNTNLETTEKVAQGKLSQVAQKSLSVLSYSEIRDSRVAFFVDEMIPGEYEYTYVARATTAGKFLRPSGLAEAMYQPQIMGRTATDYVSISE